MLKSQQRFKSKNQEVYMENINKIALSSNHDKRIVAFGRNYELSLWIRSKELGYAVLWRRLIEIFRLN